MLKIIVFLSILCKLCLPAYGVELALPQINWFKIKDKDIDITDWSLLSEDEIQNLYQELDSKQRMSDLETLKLAKFALVNGDPYRAKFLLRRISKRGTKILRIKTRYLALIHFLIDDIETSYKYYHTPGLGTSSSYKEICQMKIFTEIAVGDTDDIEIEFDLCHEQIKRYSKTNQIWTDAMMRLALGDKSITTGRSISILTDILNDESAMRMWLKMGIYLGYEHKLVEQIKTFPMKLFKSKEVRELLAFVYYRTGNMERALKLVEDIDTPNASNIKGNVYLTNKKYEVAFGHFKLALQKKQNSLNALERSLPLAWLLRQWSAGLEFLQLNVTNHDTDIATKGKFLLTSAFKLQQQKNKSAAKNIDYIDQLYHYIPPKEISVIATYSALVNEQIVELSAHADRACGKMLNGISCWIKAQSLIWDDFSKRIKQKKPTFKDDLISIDWLMNPEKLLPIEEEIYLEQDEIERLDEEISSGRDIGFWLN